MIHRKNISSGKKELFAVNFSRGGKWFTIINISKRKKELIALNFSKDGND